MRMNTCLNNTATHDQSGAASVLYCCTLCEVRPASLLLAPAGCGRQALVVSCAALVLLQGSVLIKQPVRVVAKYKEDGTPVERSKVQGVVLHCDIIGDAFWQENAQVLGIAT